MKTAIRTKKRTRFNSSNALLAKLKSKRPDLIEAAERQPLRLIVAKNLLRLRGEAALSREALASRCDVGARSIQRIEEGREDANPTLRVLEALAHALKVPASDLTDPKGTMLGLKNS